MDGGALIMVPIAVAMSGALATTLWRIGMMQRGRRLWWLARIGAALFAYAALNIAFPLNESNQAIRVIALLGMAVTFIGVVWFLAERADAPAVARVGQPMRSEVLYDMEDADEGIEGDDGDWVVVPADDGAVGELHDTQRRTDSGGAGAVGQMAVAGESGVPRQPDGNRQGTGEDNARDGMAASAAAAAANRSGRGRRLHGSVLSRQSTRYPSAGGYDAAGAAIASSIAATGATSLP